MAFIATADRERIEAAIRAAETKTSGEFVTVVARASDAYLTLPTLYASGLALMTPLVLSLLRVETRALPLFLIQVAVFVTLALVFLWTPVTMRLVPHGAKMHRAARLAREQFFLRGLHETVERHGVLLFVSVAERYVEIIADRGIHAKVPDGAWDAIVADFTRTVGDGRIADGFVGAIERCGALLAAHFPRRPEDRDELANRLFEI
jgi:putative membrane protein